MVDKPADGMVIEYEELSHTTSTSEGGDGAVPEGGFSHPYTKHLGRRRVVSASGSSWRMGILNQPLKIILSQAKQNMFGLEKVMTVAPNTYSLRILQDNWTHTSLRGKPFASEWWVFRSTI